MFNNRSKFQLIAFSILVVSVLFSCNKIIEEDISDDIPILILPQNNATISTNPVHFKWHEMNGATKYHLEIVSPSFDNISSYDLDSIVTGGNFYFNLDSNQYEFRITAMNGAYSSKTLGPISFVVGTSLGSSNPAVTLNSPNQNAYFNGQFDGAFSWFTLPGTNTYTFELHETTTFAGPLLDIFDQIGTNGITSLDGQTLGEGTYSWGVKAFLSNGEETNFSKRIFYIDTIAPGISNGLLPANNSNEPSGSITFEWTLPTDVGTIQSPVQSILQISTDITFTSLLAPDTTSNLSLTKTLLQGTYYWRVQTVDEAGNDGPVPSGYNVLNVTP